MKWTAYLPGPNEADSGGCLSNTEPQEQLRTRFPILERKILLQGENLFALLNAVALVLSTRSPRFRSRLGYRMS
ncbi:hypothetical protein J1614_003430 [Plenodomus biglobosus]|nr:hypothetical protein J1614_003430 [Plenodomus biglobosus]